jgi:2-polyprenyl-3-methyl-5-hydroxy-6-metoxy-1,4-benzoquinol methylase
VSTLEACRSCAAKDIFPFLSLGDHPLANALITAERLGEPETTYPLEVVMCTNCSLVQITETVPPEILFRDYIYFSSFSDTMLRHARELAEGLLQKRHLGPESLVIEIASNDGYLLKNFVAAGVPVLGIEPARNIAKIAIEQGIRTISEFFGSDLAAQLAAEYQPDVILANNVMAHAPDINGMIAGIKTLLKPDGVFVLETPYLKDMLEKIEFDTMYHEHVFCHSLTALEHAFQRHGLAASDVEWLPLHGGTIRVSVVHTGCEGSRPAVRRMLDDESAWGVSRPETYRDFADKVKSLGGKLTKLLRDLKTEGKRIAAYGAAAKGTTLLNSFGIGRNSLEYIVDLSTHKQGKFMPGNHLPIYAPEHLTDDQPDYTLLLAWNLVDEILEQQAEYHRRGGRFIIPIPEIRVV